MPVFDDIRTIPRIVSGFDRSGMAIDPFSGLVLDAVDGVVSVEAIAESTGLDLLDVAEMLEKLRESGVVEAAPRAPARRPLQRSSAEAETDSAIDRPTLRAPAEAERQAKLARPSDEPPAGSPSAKIPAVEDSDLSPALKSRVDAIFDSLEETDHYSLLGVEQNADRKAIKTAYYALASTFHTDRHFGTKLGAYKSRMERIFGRITIAHDTLANAVKRAEYDEYLGEQGRMRVYEKLLAAPIVEEEEPPLDVGGPGASPPGVSSPYPASPVATTYTRADSSGGYRATVTPRAASADSSGPHARVGAGTPELDRQRRETLARRLMGARGQAMPRPGEGKPASSTSSSTMRATSPSSTSSSTMRAVSQSAPRVVSEDAKAATEAIRRRYEETRAQSRAARAKTFIEAAQQAIGKDDLVTAASQYRLAAKQTDDPAVHALADEYTIKARTILVATYMKSAKYEESQEKWAAAAMSYGKAIDARPESHEAHERAANALRMEGRDLHRAARLAEIAVQMDGANAPYRVTLAQVYMDAGLMKRARGELEQAQKLAPDDANVKALLARVRKMSS